jgi:hypothetical protein
LVVSVSLKCPACNSQRLNKAGLRCLANRETVQRYLCPDCGFRFSEKSYKQCRTSRNRRVCATCQGAKNLEEQTQYERPAGGTNQNKTSPQIKGKLVEYCFHMQKQGYSEATIRLNRIALKVLLERGADLLNPESVKDVIAKQTTWSQSRKRNAINAYSLFLKINGLTWEKPKSEVSRKIPFIPTEAE